MKISEVLNTGDLVRFNYRHSPDHDHDLGVVLFVDSDEEEVGIHWRDEDDQLTYHEHEEIDDWHSRGMLERVSENR